LQKPLVTLLVTSLVTFYWSKWAKIDLRQHVIGHFHPPSQKAPKTTQNTA
jgi:hypothetical protein